MLVAAGAAKAAETIVVAIARTKKAFAQYLPKEEYTEEQSELGDVGVIGSLYGSLLRPETLVPTVTSPARRTYYTKVAPIVFIDWPSPRFLQTSIEQVELGEEPQPAIWVRETDSISDKKGDSVNHANGGQRASMLQGGGIGTNSFPGGGMRM